MRNAFQAGRAVAFANLEATCSAMDQEKREEKRAKQERFLQRLEVTLAVTPACFALDRDDLDNHHMARDDEDFDINAEYDFEAFNKVVATAELAKQEVGQIAPSFNVLGLTASYLTGRSADFLGKRFQAIPRPLSVLRLKVELCNAARSLLLCKVAENADTRSVVAHAGRRARTSAAPCFPHGLGFALYPWLSAGLPLPDRR
ncbi:unnamed protein product [Symbiodinium natans]|uniref:Uncharacterized protein n=1 Tax=Symbiodinium natans TaxID=878477 RepID=A0A812PFL4_9DINO|nr:unnamed protein product [Symbiodinium natans]